jgi:hypothetical protein
LAMFVGAPMQATCWHGIGGALTDPHYWDAYCAAVDAEWQGSLSMVDRLLQWPALAIVLFVGGIALARIGWVLLRRRPTRSGDLSCQAPADEGEMDAERLVETLRASLAPDERLCERPLALADPGEPRRATASATSSWSPAAGAWSPRPGRRRRRDGFDRWYAGVGSSRSRPSSRPRRPAPWPTRSPHVVSTSDRSRRRLPADGALSRWGRALGPGADGARGRSVGSRGRPGGEEGARPRARPLSDGCAMSSTTTWPRSTTP